MVAALALAGGSGLPARSAVADLQWDAHTHLSWYGEEALVRLVESGVTAVRDCGGDAQQLRQWRDEIAAGLRTGPRIHFSGPALDGAKDARFRLSIATPEEARAAVDELARHGVDFIKTHNGLSRDTYFAVLDQARRHGLAVASHLPKGVPAWEAVEAGVASIEHAAESLLASPIYAGYAYSADEAMAWWRSPAGDAAIVQLAASGVAVTPTLVTYEAFTELRRNTEEYAPRRAVPLDPGKSLNRHVPTAARPPEAVAESPDAGRHAGVLLESLNWIEAREILTRDRVVVIPLGAAAKEHGPHLPLRTDLTMAEYLAQAVLEQADVVVAPMISYHYYPAFAEYPGSTSLRFETARDLVADIVRSLARHGPRRFYVLNTGLSTLQPLRAAAEQLAADGILLHVTDMLRVAAPVEREIAEQKEGTHADEIETSILLYLSPDSVDMSQATREYPTRRPGGLTPDPRGAGTYSPSGVYGDATLATREKGEKIVAAMIQGILAEIGELRIAPLPGQD